MCPGKCGERSDLRCCVFRVSVGFILHWRIGACGSMHNSDSWIILRAGELDRCWNPVPIGLLLCWRIG